MNDKVVSICVCLMLAGCGDDSVGLTGFTTTTATTMAEPESTHPTSSEVPTTSGTTHAPPVASTGGFGGSTGCAGACECVDGEGRSCALPPGECPGQQSCIGGAWGPCEPQACDLCGDGVCTASETPENCCTDCGCNGGKQCAGACTCPEGQTECAAICTDPTVDTVNCGACGHVCADDQLCVAGQCQLNCQPTDPPTEVCDGFDNDCDGHVDEDPACVKCQPLDDIVVTNLMLQKGDADFDDHGPNVLVKLTATASPTAVQITAEVTMTETTSDWTQGYKKVPGEPSDVDNLGLYDEDNFAVFYMDTDHDLDDALMEAGFPPAPPWLHGVSCYGDTPGGDVCSNKDPPECSACTIELNCINVRIAPK